MKFNGARVLLNGCLADITVMPATFSRFLALLGGLIFLSTGAMAQVDSTPRYSSQSVSAQTAENTFRVAKTCLELSLRIESAADVNTLCKRSAKYGEHTALCSDAAMSRRSSRINATQKEQVGCSADPTVLDRNFHAALVAAAKTGDRDAEICYVAGWNALDAQERAEYIRNAESFIKSGLNRGDWRVVELLSISIESQAHGGGSIMNNLPEMGSYFTSYRFNRLLQWGAIGDYAGTVRVGAENERRFLTKAQIRNANEWAREQYRRTFSHSPKLSSAPTVCLATTSGD